MYRPAYGYVSLPRQHPPDAEVRLRHCLAQFAACEDLDLRNIFVDRRESQPYGFAALLTVMTRTGVRLVVLPDLTHVEHIATVSALTQAGLGLFLKADVLLTTPVSAVPAQSRPAHEPAPVHADRGDPLPTRHTRHSARPTPGPRYRHVE